MRDKKWRNKELVSGIYKEFFKLNSKKTNNLIKKLSHRFIPSKEDAQIPKKYIKNAQNH